MRGSIITLVWALSTMAVSSVSYVATRTSGNLADCSQEHVIVNILKARALVHQCPTTQQAAASPCQLLYVCPGLTMRLNGQGEGGEMRQIQPCRLRASYD